MATRIENIIKDARVTLADKDAQRWSDSDLLRLVDEAHRDFATKTKLLTGRIEIPLEVGNPYFDLPEDVWFITRVLYGDEVLPVASHSELDRLGTTTILKDFGLSPSNTWEADEGSPEAFLYDRRNLSEGKVYPIPDESILSSAYGFEDRIIDIESGVFNNIYGFAMSVDSFEMSNLEGCVTEADEVDLKQVYGVMSEYGDSREQGYGGDGVFGFTVSIDGYTADSIYGLVGDIYDPSRTKVAFNSPYGVLSLISDIKNNLKIYYVKIPQHLELVTDDLLTPQMFDKALKYYVIGHSFLNDLDTEYQAKGMQQLQLYERELIDAKSTEIRDGVRTGTLQTQYRGAF